MKMMLWHKSKESVEASRHTVCDGMDDREVTIDSSGSKQNKK